MLAWWCMPVIPALWRLKQEDLEFKVILEHIVRPQLKKKVLYPYNLILVSHKELIHATIWIDLQNLILDERS
jgi:hypothetical protein